MTDPLRELDGERPLPGNLSGDDDRLQVAGQRRLPCRFERLVDGASRRSRRTGSVWTVEPPLDSRARRRRACRAIGRLRVGYRGDGAENAVRRTPRKTEGPDRECVTKVTGGPTAILTLGVYPG